MRRDCSLIGAAADIGQPNEGTELAPSWLRVKGFREAFAKNFQIVRDLGDITAKKSSRDETLREKLLQLDGYSKNLAALIKSELKKGRFVFTLGGDHSVAVGTLGATLGYDPDVKVIWIDAHADINTPQTSPSENTHGMPVALAMGLGEHPALKGLFGWLPKLSPENIAYIGLRDIDEGEEKILAAQGICHFSASDVELLGIESVLERVKNHLDPDGNSNFHISFDVDGIDPAFFPSTGTPVNGGISLLDGQSIIEYFRKTNRLIAMDLVEVNPLLGDNKDLYISQESAKSLVSSLGPGEVLTGLLSPSRRPPSIRQTDFEKKRPA